jgi:hypothetical protein
VSGSSIHRTARLSSTQQQAGSCRVRAQHSRAAAWAATIAAAPSRPPKQNSAVTRCTGPFGGFKKENNIGQLGKVSQGEFMADSIKNAGATYWGGDAGTVCNTVLLKPIMTCGEGCISDNRCVQGVVVWCWLPRA